MISRTVLVAPEAFNEALSAERAAAAIGRGLRAAGGDLEVDLCPIPEADRDAAAIKEHLASIDFATRMLAARAIVVGAAHLDETTLLGSVTFELATRARQAGVPAYAVAGANSLDLFDTRILDLQVTLEGRDTRALRRAGEKLAQLV